MGHPSCTEGISESLLMLVRAELIFHIDHCSGGH